MKVSLIRLLIFSSAFGSIGNGFAQNPILRSTTTGTPTIIAQITPSILTQKGNFVGIGTTTPSQRLTLQSSLESDQGGGASIIVPPTIRFEHDWGLGWSYWHITGGNKFNIENPATNIIPMSVSGLGEIDFMDKVNLNVQNITGTNNNKLGFLVNNTTRRIFWTSYTSSTNNTAIPLEFMYDAQGSGSVDVTAMTIMPNGQVRIGPKNTTFESYTLNAMNNNDNGIRLTVNGGIATSRIVVTTQNWADWVFYDRLKNPTLEEEQQSIEKNCTLVGVPSEKDVVNGADLAEINAILLAKIEQNYLHDIEQQEMIKLLLERIILLEKKFENKN